MFLCEFIADVSILFSEIGIYNNMKILMLQLLYN